jgi:hypothetical protein
MNILLIADDIDSLRLDCMRLDESFDRRGARSS